MAASATVSLNITGLHCPSCSMLVQMELDGLPGVESAVADFRTGVTEVTYDPELISVDALLSTVVAAGYGAEVAG